MVPWKDMVLLFPKTAKSFRNGCQLLDSRKPSEDDANYALTPVSDCSWFMIALFK